MCKIPSLCKRTVNRRGEVSRRFGSGHFFVIIHDRDGTVEREKEECGFLLALIACLCYTFLSIHANRGRRPSVRGTTGKGREERRSGGGER